MSIDEQYAQMQRFQRALVAFNEHLRESVVDLEAQHENVSPLWQDEMRRLYDSVWDPFREMIKHYIKVEGPGYVEFLSVKVRALERYFYGG